VVTTRHDLGDIVDRLLSWDDQQPPFGTMCEAAEEIRTLRRLGDALADSGGQHGLDDAIDAWKDHRERG
jgi:hypothetical protein